ncbi:hypothetical protein AVEN_222910-1 [Araneus ventricosus]|uniref:Uncharacterized protein n=1 Tax=Araneus ventricosus TaxID=182803 RepID=A0A4Y2LDX1_ARAVE|nr:hypothetical protein AVEN_222910-1 [Araneus ventricosus]
MGPESNINIAAPTREARPRLLLRRFFIPILQVPSGGLLSFIITREHRLCYHISGMLNDRPPRQKYPHCGQCKISTIMNSRCDAPSFYGGTTRLRRWALDNWSYADGLGLTFPDKSDGQIGVY